MRLLLIADESEKNSLLVSDIKDNYCIESAPTGELGTYLSEINEYDLVLVDSYIDNCSSKHICKELRDCRKDSTILLLDRGLSPQDKVEYLDLGVDYITPKDTAPIELPSRIRSILRRKYQMNSPICLDYGLIRICLVEKNVYVRDCVVKLRRLDYMLLSYLFSNVSRLLSKEDILDHVWDSEYLCATNTVEVHIKELRDRIENKHNIKFIETVRGMGYRIHYPVDTS